jgi:hypothetical protein
VEKWEEATWGRGWSRHAAVPACKVDTVISILSILCDTRIYQAPLSLSRQRSFARHPAQDTVQTRHPPPRPQHDSHAAQPAFTPPTRISPLRHASCTSQPY